MRIACIRHVPFEGAGAIADWALSHCHRVVGVAAPEGAFPAPDTFDMLVVMGGPMSADDVAGHPWLAAESACIREAIDAGRLVLGVCLGSQLVAQALGGTVRRAARSEIGWFPVRLTPAGRASQLFGAWPDEFVAGHWHGDTFDLPAGVESTASSALTPNQAFEARGGRVVGLQFHLEWTEPSLRVLIDSCPGDLVEPGEWNRGAEGLLGGDAEIGATKTLLFDLLDRMEALG